MHGKGNRWTGGLISKGKKNKEGKDTGSNGNNNNNISS